MFQDRLLANKMIQEHYRLDSNSFSVRHETSLSILLKEMFGMKTPA